MSAKLFLMMKAVSETIGRRLNCLQFHNFLESEIKNGTGRNKYSINITGKSETELLRLK
jgi:hypothetical protein